jgi:formylglycine-generating enzyme required for sulfatase activity
MDKGRHRHAPQTVLTILLGALLFEGLWSLSAPSPDRPNAALPLRSNSLGMVFVAVIGTKVEFSRFETRVQDFGAFVAATRYSATNDVFSPGDDGWKRRGWNWLNPGFPQGPTHPVTGVSWHDAKEFCRWLTATERKAGLLSDRQSYRLPMDLEWSTAAGLLHENGRTPDLRSRQVGGVYPWGTSWPPTSSSGNFAGLESGLIHVIDGFRDSFPQAAPVGSFAPNSFGLYDMGGNVWEWCEDWFDSDERYKVMRGGSWFSSGAETLLASHRDKDPPGLRNLNIGFRVVLVTNE